MGTENGSIAQKGRRRGGILLILRADPENSKKFFKWGGGRSRVSGPSTKAIGVRVPLTSRIHGRILSMTLPIQPGNE